MSAFIVNDKTINRCLSNLPVEVIRDSYYKEMLERKVFGTNDADKMPKDYNFSIDSLLTYVGQALLRENIVSVNYRYPSSATSEAIAELYKFNRVECSLMQSLKSLDCLKYQSCEHKEWEDSSANRLIELITSITIKWSKDYQDAEWG